MAHPRTSYPAAVLPTQVHGDSVAPRRPSGLELTQKHKYGVLAWHVYSSVPLSGESCLANPWLQEKKSMVLPALVARTGRRKGARQRLNGTLPKLLLPRKRKTVSKSKCYHPRHVSLLTQIGQSFHGVQADTEMYHASACMHQATLGSILSPSTPPTRSMDRFHIRTRATHS